MNSLLDTPVAAEFAKAKQQKILLVDDDPGIRQILVRLLNDENFIVVTAANGVEAIALNESAKFDLVLLDLNMPLKNGWETFDQLTAKDPLMPIIVITARPNQFFPALASGIGALLEKPLDFTKLFQTISDLLEESQELRLSRTTSRSSAMSYASATAGAAHDN